jgi:hypothetical protein
MVRHVTGIPQRLDLIEAVDFTLEPQSILVLGDAITDIVVAEVVLFHTLGVMIGKMRTRQLTPLIVSKGYTEGFVIFVVSPSLTTTLPIEQVGEPPLV